MIPCTYSMVILVRFKKELSCFRIIIHFVLSYSWNEYWFTSALKLLVDMGYYANYWNNFFLVVIII